MFISEIIDPEVEELTYLHEMGHALGLNHAPEGFSSHQTVMVKTDAGNAILGALDILAIQQLYGKSDNYHVGDTVYNVLSDDVQRTGGTSGIQHLSTIWDSGGLDLLDASESTAGSIIDLRPITLSEASSATNVVFTSSTSKAFSIGYGADIENAIGSNHDDIIHGNDPYDAATDSMLQSHAAYQGHSFNGANSLVGGEGNDTLYGYGGDDTLVGGNDDDHLYGGTGQDKLYGGNGSDKYYFNSDSGSCTIYDGGATDEIYINGERIAGNVQNRDGYPRLESMVEILIVSDNRILIRGPGGLIDLDNFWNGAYGITLYDFPLGSPPVGLIGSDVADILTGNNGNDRLEGLGGDDTLQGGLGNDTLLGGSGYDTYRVGVAGDGAETVIDADGKGEIVITDTSGIPLFSVTGKAFLEPDTVPEASMFALFAKEPGGEIPPEEPGPGPEEPSPEEPPAPEEPPVDDGKQRYVISKHNVLFEYDPETKELVITGWNGSDGGSIRIQNFNSGDLGIKLIDPSLNIAPEITGFDVATRYAVLGAPVRVDADIALSDDSEVLHSATVVIANKADAGEVLAVDVMDTGIAASYDAAMGTLTLSGEASTADYEAVLETLTYSNASGGLATLGTRNLSLTINDGELDSESAQALVDVTVTPSMSGTDGFNVLIGTHGQDIIDAKGGKDLIHAHFGDDLVFGGNGNDTVFGGKGDDSLLGSGGNDVLQGDHGNDHLVGGDGKDLLIGGHGVDRFIYTQLSDSTASSGDVIKDFGRGDKIDLSALDITFDDLDIAVHGPGWHGQHGFFGNLLGHFMNSTSIAIDGTDFEIQLSGRHSLAETDFVF